MRPDTGYENNTPPANRFHTKLLCTWRIAKKLIKLVTVYIINVPSFVNLNWYGLVGILLERVLGFKITKQDHPSKFDWLLPIPFQCFTEEK